MKRCFVLILAALLIVCCISKAENPRIKVTKLRCEYRADPLGIDIQNPRLSWILESNVRSQRQTSYQVIVASKQQNLHKGYGDLWDSGKVNSNESLHVVYKGKALKSEVRCYWKVRIWDKDGKVSKWSKAAWWEMALLNSDDWNGRWINDGKKNPEKEMDFYSQDPAPLFRKDFELDKSIRKARLYISGLGYYEAYLNGNRVGDYVLNPAWSVYSKRVYYNCYDVTKQVNMGRNCLGVMVGGV